MKTFKEYIAEGYEKDFGGELPESKMKKKHNDAMMKHCKLGNSHNHKAYKLETKHRADTEKSIMHNKLARAHWDAADAHARASKNLSHSAQAWKMSKKLGD